MTMAELLPEKWMKVMAVTTTVLGVVASIATSRASFYITKSQLSIAQEADQWAYYQAKSIKEDLYEIKVKALQFKEVGALAFQKDFIGQAIQQYSKDIKRYGKEKAEIKKYAEGDERQNRLFSKRAAQFSLSVVFAQIAILLSSIAVLLKLRRLWFLGLVFGLISLFFIANGFLVFLKI